MSGSVAVFPLGFRVTDQNGAVASGAQIRFFNAGTSTPKPVYSNEALTLSLGSIVYTRSDGLPVASQGSDTTVSVFIGTGLYKIDILDADGVTIIPAKDNQPGAVAITDDGTPTATTPVIVHTGTNSVGATENGKLIRGNSAGGSVTDTLQAAAVLGDGWNARFEKSAAANTYTIAASGSDTINGLASVALKDQYDFVEIHCDGSAFYVGAQSIRARQRAIGDIRLASVSGARTGELECTGASLLRTDYPDLFLAIGTQHGAADATHFNLPKYSGNAFRVWDHGAGRDPDAAGRTAPSSGGNTGDNPGTLQADALITHTHTTPSVVTGAATLGTTGSDTAATPVVRALTTAAGTSGNPSTGTANETRGKNVYVAAYILATTF